MNPEDSPRLFAMGAGFTSETGTVPGIFFREHLSAKPFVHMKSRDGLFGGGNEILFIGAVQNLFWSTFFV